MVFLAQAFPDLANGEEASEDPGLPLTLPQLCSPEASARGCLPTVRPCIARRDSGWVLNSQYEYCDLCLGPLEEQQVLLTGAPSL